MRRRAPSSRFPLSTTYNQSARFQPRRYTEIIVPLPERALIYRIRQRAGESRSISLARGIGDDCAILRPPLGRELLVTTDFCLENVHFRRDWHPAKAVGHRCLVRGLSDIAAMGGEPLAVFLSLALPSELPQRWVNDFFDGLLALAESWQVPLAGGDIAQSPNGILADITVLGSVPKGGAIQRSTAHPGDLIYVTGTLGLSVAALNQLRAGKKLTARQAPRHFFPQPRIDIGRVLRNKKLASAMIDLSDGLSSDLSHICDESKVGAVLYSGSIPHPATPDGLDLALNGGEDYELLFTASPNTRVPKQVAGVPITTVGEMISRRGLWLADASGKRSAIKPRGWEHFRDGAK
jgi:thiamine-monophosphate kinase